MTEFTRLVQMHFDFLIHDFGFNVTAGDESVRYDLAPVYVGISRGKGEIDVLFRVKVDTETIRPYLTHVFSLDQVVRYYKKGPFPTFASFPAVPGIGGEQRYLMYLAALTKKYCGDLLRGDITAFERLSRSRGPNTPDSSFDCGALELQRVFSRSNSCYENSNLFSDHAFVRRLRKRIRKQKRTIRQGNIVGSHRR